MGKRYLGHILAVKAFDLHYISDRYEDCPGSDPQVAPIMYRCLARSVILYLAMYGT
jgi:hypothetical protein